MSFDWLTVRVPYSHIRELPVTTSLWDGRASDNEQEGQTG